MVDQSCADRAPGADCWPERTEGAAGEAPADGLIGLYALRALDRGTDPRLLAAEHRAVRYGSLERVLARPDRAPRQPVRRVGRGTDDHRTAVRHARQRVEHRQPRPRRIALPSLTGLTNLVLGPRPLAPGVRPRRLATAGLAAMLAVSFAGASVHAEGAPPQQRYVAQPGDSLDAIAARFGVDPAAVLAASALTNPPEVQPAEVVVIPAPGQSAEEAAQMASALEGTSPFVVGAHVIAPGETLADVAFAYGLSVSALAGFNCLDDPDLLVAGQRLLIPATEDEAAIPEVVAAPLAAPASEPVEAAPESAAIEAASAVGTGWSSGMVLPGVPTYRQQYNLSCEYAAAFIATSAFGAGIPESVFIAHVPPALNPHWGYRGNIDGPWGGTDDYGVYPEALVPTLNANGFAADVFYAAGDRAALRARLDAGLPVLTWLGYWGNTGVTLDDEGTYTVAAGMHVVVAYGYDDGGVYVSDPGSGSTGYYPWDDFLAMWGVLGGMSLAVAPF